MFDVRTRKETSNIQHRTSNVELKERRPHMFRMFHIREHQRGLWFRRGDFVDLLMPGSTWLLHPADTVEIVDTLVTRFEHKLLDVLIDKPQVRAQLEIVDLGAMERAIVWKDGRLYQILAPGRHAFWKTSAKLEIEIYSIQSEVRFTHPKLQAILQSPGATNVFDGVMVADHEDVLLYRDGVLIDRLGQGLHVFWK